MSFNDLLHDAIYGGPVPKQELESVLVEHHLRWPVRVAVDFESGDDRRALWVYQPGDGLIYLTHHGRGQKDGWALANDPHQWVWAMQQCILKLRRLSLSGPMHVSAENVEQLRRIALHRCLGKSDWQEAVKCWADLVLRRTHRKIHDAQRAFLSFVLAVGEPLETIGEVGHRHHHALQGLLSVYTGEALVRWLVDALEIVCEQWARQNRKLDSSLRRALTYLEANASEPISLGDVAGAVPMAPASLSRKFQAMLGESFTHYLQGLRLERATILLLCTNRTVLDIALDCGFGSVEQFHRVFKQRLGVTPLTYRRRALQANKTETYDSLRGPGIRNRTIENSIE